MNIISGEAAVAGAMPPKNVMDNDSSKSQKNGHYI